MGSKQVINEPLSGIRSGEVSGSVTAKQLPDIPCIMAWIGSVASNANPVYLGGPGVTVPDGTTDATSGIELASAGQLVGPIPVRNLNELFIIGTAATDDICYLAG